MTPIANPARLLAAAATIAAIVVAAGVALVLRHRGPQPGFGSSAPRLPAVRAAAYPITAYPRATRASAVRTDAGLPARPIAAVAYLRGAHLSPDTAAVDVYLTGFAGGRTTLWLSNVGYGDVSAYRRIAAGTYVVSMRPHGADASSAPVASWTVRLAAGRSYTAAAIGDGAQLHGIVLRDSLRAPHDHLGAVRVIQAADRIAAPTVRIQGGPTLATALRFADTTGYLSVAPGRHTVVVDAGTATAKAAVTIAPRSTTSLVVLDSGGSGVTVRAFADTAAPTHVPKGPVDAGGGATASGALTRSAAPAPREAAPAPSPAFATAATHVRRRADRPVALAIPAIGVRTRLTPLERLADGLLQPPPHWQTAGWYAGGIVPGRPGPAVVVGHVDSVTGPAVFYRLRQVRSGERAVIRTAAGRRLSFVIDSVRRYSKAHFPAQKVYGPTPDAELRLITCTGAFDVATASYLDNLVVSAHLAR